MEDSVFVVSKVIGQSNVTSSDMLETLSQIAMVVIAAFDTVLTILLYGYARRDTTEIEAKHRKFDLIQTIILNNNLHKFYRFYDDVNETCQQFLQSDDPKLRQQVDLRLKQLLKQFRLEFIVLFNVIDAQIYQEMLETVDELIDHIVNTIYDEGINLKYEPKYNELIAQPISKNRNAMLNVLCRLANLS